MDYQLALVLQNRLADVWWQGKTGDPLLLCLGRYYQRRPPFSTLTGI